MGRKFILGLLTLCTLLLVGLLIRVATRKRVEVLHTIAHSQGYRTQYGPIALAENILTCDQSRLLVLNEQLVTVDEVAFPFEHRNDLFATRDGSIAFVLDYREFWLVDLRTKAVKSYPLDFFATTGFLSPNGKHLWIGEYETSKFRQWRLEGTEATKVAESDIKLEARNHFGAPRLGGNHDFRIVGLANDGAATILHSDDFNALLIFDWQKLRALGTIDLPNLTSYPTFSQSPSGQFLGIVQNWLVIVDVRQLKTVFTRELDDGARALDFNAAEDRIFIGYRAPDMFAIPYQHRGGQIDEFDFSGRCVNTWHSDLSRIECIHTRTANLWISGDDKIQRFRWR
jgi:hypothetical protein